jgi:hypothetical protein
VLLASTMVGSLIAAEDNNDTLLSVDEASVENQEIVVDPPGNIKAGNNKNVAGANSAVASKQKDRRPVKMIVGGQSTDGIAKEIILHVED